MMGSNSVYDLWSFTILFGKSRTDHSVLTFNFVVYGLADIM